MLLIRVIVLTVLIVLFIQDILNRSVYWLIFPVLTALFIAERLMAQQSLTNICKASLINCVFLAVQLLLVSVYFSLKQGKWVNISLQLLGLGDILFFLCTAFYLSVLNYLFFYIISLFGVLMFWIVWQMIMNEKNEQIPLAGLQALIFGVFLASDWWYAHLNLTDDYWLLHLITKWT